MDSTVDTSSPHENAAQLIPWLINGTLGADEAAWLRAHLDSCEPCRRDLDAERRLYGAIRAEGPLVLSGEPSLQKLLARIEADEFAAPAAAGTAPALEPAPSSGEPRRRVRRGIVRHRAGRRGGWRTPGIVRWLTAAVVVEALALGLVSWSWQATGLRDAAADPSLIAASGQDAASYRTLTTPAPHYGAGARVRVVFRSGLSLEQLQMILQSVAAHIVDGPTDARVFTLGFAEPVSDRVLDARIAKLRADPDVLLAEPAGGRP